MLASWVALPSRTVSGSLWHSQRLLRHSPGKERRGPLRGLPGAGEAEESGFRARTVWLYCAETAPLEASDVFWTQHLAVIHF